MLYKKHFLYKMNKRYNEFKINQITKNLSKFTNDIENCMICVFFNDVEWIQDTLNYLTDAIIFYTKDDDDYSRIICLQINFNISSFIEILLYYASKSNNIYVSDWLSENTYFYTTFVTHKKEIAF